MMKADKMQYGSMYSSLNPEQKSIFDRLLQGENIFITGNAGTGKSYLVKAFDEHCTVNGIHLVKTAPTGIAANEIGGATLHHQFLLKTGLDFDKPEKLKKKQEFLLYTDILLIDEISMVRIDIFDKLMEIINTANNIRQEKHKKPIQLIFVGDFFQLPPVITPDERPHLNCHYDTDIGDGYCFQSRYWNMFKIQTVNLTTVIRQSDKAFCNALDLCKMGDSSCIDFVLDNSAQSVQKDAIWVCGKNRTADDKNNEELAKVSGMLYTFTAKYSGDVSEKDKLCDAQFKCKIGARVVMLVNDNIGHVYQNGSIGEIVDIGDGYIKVLFEDSCSSQKTAKVSVARFSKYEYVLTDETAPDDDLLSLLCSSIGEAEQKAYFEKSEGNWKVVVFERKHGKWGEQEECDEYVWRISNSTGSVTVKASVTDDGKMNYSMEGGESETMRTMVARAFSQNGIVIGNVKVKKRYTRKDMTLSRKEVGYAEQFPMRLGYAVTVHKSQGQTYDAMNFIPEIWGNGQLYVALSRCKTVSNIFISGRLYGSMVKTSGEVLKFYNAPELYSFFEKDDMILNIPIKKKYRERILALIEQWENEEKLANGQPAPAAVPQMQSSWGFRK